MDEQVNTKSRYFVALAYSSDDLPVGGENKKAEELYAGDDLVTKVLKHFGVNFSIALMSDFYNGEPILSSVNKTDKHGNNFSLYNEWSSFIRIEGQHQVLEVLESLGVVPCSIDEAVKISEDKK